MLGVAGGFLALSSHGRRQEGDRTGEKKRKGTNLSFNQESTSWMMAFIRCLLLEVSPLNTVALSIKFPAHGLWGTHTNHSNYCEFI